MKLLIATIAMIMTIVSGAYAANDTTSCGIDGAAEHVCDYNLSQTSSTTRNDQTTEDVVLIDLWTQLSAYRIMAEFDSQANVAEVWAHTYVSLKGDQGMLCYGFVGRSDNLTDIANDLTCGIKEAYPPGHEGMKVQHTAYDVQM